MTWPRKLHKVEEGCQKILSSCNVNMDTMAVLPYKGRSDDRSKRPVRPMILVYQTYN